MRWFTALTGLPDDWPATVRAGLAVQGEWLVSRGNGRRMRAGRLTLPSLASLARPAGGGRASLREVVADVRDLHADPANAGAVFQVASQFNLLEMIGPEVTPEQGIARYADDPTQGPACAMACAAGTIWRAYLVPLDGQTGQTAARQIDTARALGAALGAPWTMRNGYLLPHPGALAPLAPRIAARAAELRGLLQVGVQADTEVTLPGAGHTVTQVYASALPVAYGRLPAAEVEPLARLVLEAAYEATLAIAQAEALRTGNRRVFLTRLGGGAFGNPDRWIDDAILASLGRLPGLDLDIALVSHGRSHPANRALVAAGTQVLLASGGRTG